MEQGQFFIKIDHESIKYLLEQRLHTNLQQRDISKLLGLDYKILYRKGIENKVADALSRQLEAATYTLHFVVIPTCMQHRIASYEGDNKATEMIQQLSVDAAAVPRYQLKKGILFSKDKMYVGSYTSLRLQLLESYHNSPIGGHSGDLFETQEIFFLA